MPKINFKDRRVLLGGLGLILALILLIGLFVNLGDGIETTNTNSENPFGNLGSGGDQTFPQNPGGNGVGNPSNSGEGGITTPRVGLMQVTVNPVAGFSPFTSAEVTFVRFIERESGHIFETGLESIAPQKVSNLTIPRIQRTSWRGDGILFQYLGEGNDSVRTFFGTLERNEVEGGLAKTLRGFFLEDQSLGALLSPSGSTAFSLTPGAAGSIGTIIQNSDQSRSEIWGSPISGWLLEWPAERTIILTSKPHHNGEGVSFALDATTGETTKLLGGYTNLTVRTAPSLEYVFFSHTDTNGSLVNSVLTRGSGAITPLPLTTIADKCTWSAQTTTLLYCFVPQEIPRPNDFLRWYKGQIAFSDNLWRMDVVTGEVSLVDIPGLVVSGGIDAVDPILSENEQYLFFQNKKDGTLYAYRLRAGTPMANPSE